MNRKGYIILCVLVLIVSASEMFPQGIGSWSQITSFPASGRLYPNGFSNNAKMYVGLGSAKNDFWSYDTISKTWTQMTDFPGLARGEAVAFSIGNKGYYGTGETSYTVYSTDFWEYDIAGNSWTRKADFGGVARKIAVGFSIGNKGYIGLGLGGGKDFWEYDPIGDSWTRKADFPGSATRTGAVGFSINNLGYVGTGYDGSYIKSDFWEYNPSLDSWTKKSDLPKAIKVGTAFSIGKKGYVGLGQDINNNQYYFFEWDQMSNIWDTCSYFQQQVSLNSINSFPMGNNAYIMAGGNFWKLDPLNCPDPDSIKINTNDTITRGTKVTFNSTYLNASAYRWKINGFDQFVYTQSMSYTFNAISNYTVTLEIYNGSCYSTLSQVIVVKDDGLGGWTRQSDFDGSCGSGAVSFTIGNKAYIGTGSTTKDFWEWDQVTNQWTQLADFGGVPRTYAIGFVANLKGYIGIGEDNSHVKLKDFWQYDPLTNLWSQKTDFAGGPRTKSVSFTVNDTAYIICGSNNITANLSDIWKYNSSTDTWIPKKNYPGAGFNQGAAFGVNSKGYAGKSATNFYEYDPSSDTWVQKTNALGFPANGGLSLGNYGYLFRNGAFWQYNPSTNYWTSLPSYPVGKGDATGFSLNGKIYVAAGALDKQLWEYGLNHCGVSSAFSIISPYTVGSNSAHVNMKEIGAGNTVQFLESSTNAAGNSIWLMNGKVFDVLKSNWPTGIFFTFNIPGIYKITLVASNGSCRDTSSQYIKVVCAGAWTKLNSFPGINRTKTVGFSIGNKAYYGTGLTGSVIYNDFWEYNSLNDTWTQIANVPGAKRFDAVGFAIGNKGYVGTGNTSALSINSPINVKDFWEYDPSLNTWLQKADFGGAARNAASAFVIGAKGYVGTGQIFTSSIALSKDFWEFDPVGNTWIQKANFPQLRHAANAFSIDSIGYVGQGCTQASDRWNGTNDFYAYNPLTNTWTPKAKLPNEGGYNCVQVGSANLSRGYCGLSWHGTDSLFYEYRPKDNIWIPKAKLPPIVEVGEVASSFNIGKYIYFVRYHSTSSHLSELLRFDPDSCLVIYPAPAIVAKFISSATTTLCLGDSILLSCTNSSDNVIYQWKRNGVNIVGANNNYCYVTQSGNYSLLVKNFKNDSAQSNTISVAAIDMNLSIKPAGSINIQAGDSAFLYTDYYSGIQYQWLLDGFIIPNAITSTFYAKKSGNYSVRAIGPCGMRTTNQVMVNVSVISGKPFTNKASDDIIVYPNPFSSNYITLAFNGKQSPLKIDIYSINGQHIKTIIENNFNFGRYIIVLNEEEFTSFQIFFLAVEYDGKKYLKKIIRQ